MLLHKSGLGFGGLGFRVWGFGGSIRVEGMYKSLHSESRTPRPKD